MKFANDAIAQIKDFVNEIVAFITAPIVGFVVQFPLADAYLKALYPAIREQGGICISDEVQTGFGRLGDVFWGFEAHGVVERAKVVHDRETGRSRGFGFVEMPNHEEATAALENMEGKDLMGREIRCNESEARERR